MSQEELFRIRQKFIDERQTALLKTATALEKSLLNEILTQFIKSLKTKDGIIVDGGSGAQLSQSLDKIFNSFENNQQVKIASQIANDFGKILSFNEQYFSLFQVQKKRFDDIAKAVRELMRNRIGLSKDGKVVSKGYLDQFIKDSRLREAVKQMTYRAVTGQQPLNDFTEGLGLVVVGNPKVDGGLTKYYKGFAYDTYAQFDRSNNKEFAKSLGLYAGRYSGGLIEDSRQFCIDKNDKIFVVEETELWKDDETLPRTKAERESEIIIDYNPIIDMGRWRCRHLFRFISNERALKERPDLRQYFIDKGVIKK